MGILHSTNVSTLQAIPVVMGRDLSLYLEKIRLQSHPRDSDLERMEEEGEEKAGEGQQVSKQKWVFYF